MKKNYENITDVIDFGQKHIGKTIDQVLDEDPQWLRWAVLNVPGFTLSAKIENEVIEALKNKK